MKLIVREQRNIIAEPKKTVYKVYVDVVNSYNKIPAGIGLMKGDLIVFRGEGDPVRFSSGNVNGKTLVTDNTSPTGWVLGDAGGGGGGASAILYNDTGATMLAGTIVYAEEANGRLEAHKADSVCDQRLYILNDDVSDGEEVQASFVPGSIANVLCDSYEVVEGDALIIGATAGQATAADGNGTIGIAMGAKASGSIGIVKVRLTENRTVKAVNKSATSNILGHVYRIISGDATGIPLAESAAKGKQPFGVQANLQSNADGYALLKFQPGETAMVLADTTEIQVGDWLVPSYDTPGRVRAGNGYGIGRAMTSKLAGSTDSVKCLLMPGQYGISPRCWYLPSGITEDQVLAAYQFVKRNSKAEALININNGVEYPLTENGTVEWNSETGIYLPAANSNGLIQATLNNLYANVKSGGFGFAGVSSSSGIHGGILINTSRTLMVNTVTGDGSSTGNYSAGFSVSNTSSTVNRHSNVISAGVAAANWDATPKLYLNGLSVSLSTLSSTYGGAVSGNNITLGHINRQASSNRAVYFTAFVLYNVYLEAAQHLELSQNIHHLGGIEA